jgi:hypothetical protein
MGAYGSTRKAAAKTTKGNRQKDKGTRSEKSEVDGGIGEGDRGKRDGKERNGKGRRWSRRTLKMRARG